MNPYHPYLYPSYPPILPCPYYINNQLQPRTYPPVDIKKFSSSVKSFRFLMGQGNILLEHLNNPVLARRIMSAAQAGKKAEVDRLLKSMGLKVPIVTRFTPSGVVFELVNPKAPGESVSCCSLSFLMSW